MIERFNQLANELAIAEEGNLRFKSKFVPAHKVAQQYYCEKKVEMAYIYGEEETPEMKLGREAHTFLLEDTIVVKRVELLRRIFSGMPVPVREMHLLGKHNKIIIVGVADAIFFYGGYPLFLFEYKFSNRPIPFRDHHVQARLYCYLLHLMGWDTSKLKYALIISPVECKGDKELERAPLYVIKQPKEERLKIKLKKGCANIYINNFDMKEAIDELNWALDFWTEKRPAKPTAKKGKCNKCEYKEKCASS